ncbi:MAG TPA: hypothetical protein VFV75_14910 [Candidatus Polarisedimenticolaceae bacterium]|nr:hypothetical protein [Candidatus Polarisedimenticolaceae bacterium]
MTRRTSMALLITLAAAPAWAAGPYQVYRVASADAALSAPTPAFTVMSAGTVADPTLANGTNAFYFVRDGSGASLDLTMGMDRLAGTVLITFQGTGTLRDDAVGSLMDLFGPAGVLATMVGQAPPDSPLAAALELARQDGLAALDDLATNTPDRDDNAVKTWLDFCLRALENAAASPSPFTEQQILDLQDRILEIARALVTYRLELAIAQCGVCTVSGSPVCQAVKRLDDGNRLRTAGADPFRVMDAYGASINFSLQAMDACF